jgi:hypothetical protein
MRIAVLDTDRGGIVAQLEGAANRYRAAKSAAAAERLELEQLVVEAHDLHQVSYTAIAGATGFARSTVLGIFQDSEVFRPPAVSDELVEDR